MSENQAPAVVLLSGGVDSTVLLHHVIQRLAHSRAHALSFDYAQRHAKELDCARWQARAAGAASHRVIDLSFLGELLQAGTSLVAGGADVPDLADLSATQLGQPPTYIPNRNMMLLAMGAAFAEANGVYDVFYGAQAQDEYGYWDCTTDFVARLNHTLALNRARPIIIHAPFAEMPKAETVALGVELGVDFAHTWSCYRGGAQACGTCPTCVERINAFKAAGVADPIRYESAP